MTKLEKSVLEDNVANITRSGKLYKPSFLERIILVEILGKGPSLWNLKEKKTKKKKIGS